MLGCAGVTKCSDIPVARQWDVRRKKTSISVSKPIQIGLQISSGRMLFPLDLDMFKCDAYSKDPLLHLP